MGKFEVYALAIAAVVVALALGGVGGYSLGKDVERGVWEAKEKRAVANELKELKVAVGEVRGISEATRNGVANIVVRHTTIKQEVQREIRTDVRYANDCFPDTGRVLWNAYNQGVMPGSGSRSGNAPVLPRGDGK